MILGNLIGSSNQLYNYILTFSPGPHSHSSHTALILFILFVCGLVLVLSSLCVVMAIYCYLRNRDKVSSTIHHLVESLWDYVTADT